MPSYRLGQAARLLGVSVDTVRRWADRGRVKAARSSGQQRMIDGKTLALLATKIGAEDEDDRPVPASARNRMLGIVTRVVRDRVAAQVELRCGAFRIVSLLTREAADELGLAPGVMAYAVVKATNVMVSLPG